MKRNNKENEFNFDNKQHNKFIDEEKNNQQTRKTIRFRSSSFSFVSILSLMAYIGIGCIALALVLRLVFKGDTTVALVFRNIGEVIAYSLAIILAYLWVKDHKQVGWIVCYVVFVVTIVILFILNI